MGTVNILGREFRIGASYRNDRHGPLKLEGFTVPDDDGAFEYPAGLVHWRSSRGRFCGPPDLWLTMAGDEVRQI
jgi:hypothetical protein